MSHWIEVGWKLEGSTGLPPVGGLTCVTTKRAKQVGRGRSRPAITYVKRLLETSCLSLDRNISSRYDVVPATLLNLFWPSTNSSRTSGGHRSSKTDTGIPCRRVYWTQKFS
jgi:hypothetical protein